MGEKNKLIIEYIDRMRDECLKRGHIITDDVYQSVIDRFLSSPKSVEEIKQEIDLMVLNKLASRIREQEREFLKKVNIEDYIDELLTIKSIDRYGYPNIIKSTITTNGKFDFSHNAPINVSFANKNGFYKNSANTSSASLDKFEFIICQIGKMFGIKMAETYKVSIDNVSLGIISENVCNPNESLCMYSDIIKLLNIHNPEIAELIVTMQEVRERALSDQERYKGNAYPTPIVFDSEDIKTVIDSFLQVCDTLKISDEAKRSIRRDYFNMIMLDFIVNNIDRNKNNYGFIIGEDGSVRFSPLFDNSTIAIPDMPKGYQQINGFLINKEDLLGCLFNDYYDDISHITGYCATHASEIEIQVDDLCREDLDAKEQDWLMGEFTSNLHTVVKYEMQKKETPEDKLHSEEPAPKLVRVKPEQKPDNNSSANNDGKINVVMLLLAISIVLIFITLIILFKIN